MPLGCEAVCVMAQGVHIYTLHDAVCGVGCTSRTVVFDVGASGVGISLRAVERSGE